MNPATPAGSTAAGPCPCGRGPGYDRCCGPLHRGERDAATAEELMRSRYSAYALGDGAYLLRSWAKATRPRHVAVDPTITWTGLVIRHASGGAMLDSEGTVTFDAHHRVGATAAVVSEQSRFVREDGRWVYLGPLTGPPRRADRSAPPAP